MLAPLRNPLFRRMWAGQFATNIGMMAQGVACAWVMLSLSDEPGLIAAVQTAINAPVMIFALFAGVLADMFDRRHVMLAAQALVISAATALGLAAWQGALTPAWLLILTFLAGSGAALRGPAWNASVSTLVEKAQIPDAVGLNAFAFNAARAIGPGLGGLLLAVTGTASIFAMNALLGLLMVYALLAWRTLPPAPRKTSFLNTFRGMFTFLVTQRSFQVLYARAFLFALSAVCVAALLPVLVKRDYAEQADMLALFLGSYGIGAVAGVLLIQVLKDRNRDQAGRACSAVYFLCLAAIPFLPHPAVLVAVLLVAGAAWVTSLAMFNITVQMTAQPHVKGRAFALYQSTVFGGMALGALLWGALAGAQGLNIGFVGASCAGLTSLFIPFSTSQRT